MNELSLSTKNKYENLKELVRNLQSVVIGFSGGIDSTLVAKISTEILGQNAIAVIGRSATLPMSDYFSAIETAKSFGARVIEVETEETDNLKFKSNPIDRCYFCKTELFEKLKIIAHENNIKWIADGSIADDLNDYRPGAKARIEQNVISPLLETGFTKNEVRELAKFLNLPNWDKPSSPCLSSRFPYETQITKENLLKIELAEEFLKSNGFKEVRVRFQDEKTARIEIPKNEFEKILNDDLRIKIINEIKRLGFIYVALDLAGLRSGSMNEVLNIQTKIII
ncbi:MAG: ATP-dependent sacrificial sulfur transferase LarE [Bacteroidota bacterium]